MQKVIIYFGDDDINWEINNLWEIVGYFGIPMPFDYRKH